MDNTAKSISKFLLDRLKQSAALEQAADKPTDEPKALPDFPSELLGAEVPPDIQPGTKNPSDP